MVSWCIYICLYHTAKSLRCITASLLQLQSSPLNSEHPKTKFQGCEKFAIAHMLYNWLAGLIHIDIYLYTEEVETIQNLLRVIKPPSCGPVVKPKNIQRVLKQQMLINNTYKMLYGK